MAPAMKPGVEMHYMSVSGCAFSSSWLNGGKDNLGTSIFHLLPQGFVVFLDSAQELAIGVICAHMKQ